MRKKILAVLLATLFLVATITARTASPPGQDNSSLQISQIAVPVNHVLSASVSSATVGKEVLPAYCRQTSVLSNEENVISAAMITANIRAGRDPGGTSLQQIGMNNHMKTVTTYNGDRLLLNGEVAYKRDAYQWRNRHFAAVSSIAELGLLRC